MVFLILAIIAVVVAALSVVYRRALGWQIATYLFFTMSIGAVSTFVWWLIHLNSFAKDASSYVKIYGQLSAPYLMAIAGAGLLFGLIEFVLLRVIGLWRLGALTRITYYEALLQPFTLIVIVLGIATITIFSFLPFFTMGEDYRMYRDVAISLAFLFTLPIMIFASTKVIDEEIENRTMLTLMSKPIARWQVVLGKYFGVLLLCFGVITALGIIASTCAYLRYFDDMRIDYYVATSFDELTRLNLDNTKAVLAVIPAVFLEFLQIATLAAVSVAVSTRWGLALNITVTIVLYVAANLARYSGHLDLPGPLDATVAGIGHLLPGLGMLDLNQRLVYGSFNFGNLFLVRDLPSYGEIWAYIGVATVYAVFYIGAALSFGIALFRTRELI